MHVLKKMIKKAVSSLLFFFCEPNAAQGNTIFRNNNLNTDSDNRLPMKNIEKLPEKCFRKPYLEVSLTSIIKDL